MRNSMKYGLSLIVGLAMLAAARPASAQDDKKMELAGGYAYGNYKTGGGAGNSVPGGWFFQLVPKINDMASVVIDFGGTRKTVAAGDPLGNVKTSTYSGMIGPRFNLAKGAMSKVFAEALVGSVRQRASVTINSTLPVTESDWSLAFGAGVRLKNSGKVGIHAGVDYIWSFGLKSGRVHPNQDVKGVRVAIGAAF